ncbi:MAG: DHH family phosphoesterase [Acidobacteria bacterium]|nr:DHH family phosphoesterase [Acidobacteriota bacterium]
MKCLAVCQTDLVMRALHAALGSTFDVEFLVDNRQLARRLGEEGLKITAADCSRCDSYVKADLAPSTCVIIEDTGKRSIKRLISAVRDAGGTLTYVVSTGASTKRADEAKTAFPDIFTLTLGDLLGPQLHGELERSATRARVLQYQRFFADADRVLILLHNEPDPDAMAAGLALRNLLRRTKTTAIIGAIHGVSRPENVRMAHLLDIQVEKVTPDQFASFGRVATVDVQPHYFGGQLPHVDMVVDHHPEQPGYSAVFKDIRADYGSTCTILTEHLRAVDMNVSERVATAMLYAIKSDTLFFARHTNRQDLDAFTYLYPLADAALIRKMEGADITLERLHTVVKGLAASDMRGDLFFASLDEVPREDFITYTADFFLQVEDTKWTFVTGIVNDMLVLSVRNLGYSRNAGEFVRRYFGDIGSAGGHRAMAKAVVPFAAFAKRHGARTPAQINAAVAAMAEQFIHDTPAGKKDEQSKKEEPKAALVP